MTISRRENTSGRSKNRERWRRPGGETDAQKAVTPLIAVSGAVADGKYYPTQAASALAAVQPGVSGLKSSINNAKIADKEDKG
jgi:hypothetical protein